MSKWLKKKERNWLRKNEKKKKRKSGCENRTHVALKIMVNIIFINFEKSIEGALPLSYSTRDFHTQFSL